MLCLSLFGEDDLKVIRTIRYEAIYARFNYFPHKTRIIGCPRNDSNPDGVQLGDRNESGVFFCFLHADYGKIDPREDRGRSVVGARMLGCLLH